MDQYLSLVDLDYLRSGDNGSLKRLRFKVTNPGSQDDVFTLLASCSKEGTANVKPATVSLPAGAQTEVDLMFSTGWSSQNLWLTLQCFQGHRLADQRSVCVNLKENGELQILECRGGDRAEKPKRLPRKFGQVKDSSVQKECRVEEKATERSPRSSSCQDDESSVKQSEKDKTSDANLSEIEPSKSPLNVVTLDPCVEKIDTIVVKVYPYDSFSIHIKFRARIDAGEEDFCLAGVKYIASENDNDKKKALTRLEELIQTSEVRLGVIPGSGTPLLAHLGVGQEGGEELNIATMLLAEGHVIQDDGSTYSRGGYTAMAHGNVFHWHLVMLLLLRVRSEGRKFKLAVEYQPAGKFDDVYFSFQGDDGEWEHMFMQLKHNASGSGKIKISDLIKGKQKGTPRLCLKSFAQSHKNISNKKGKKYFMLVTNQGLQYENRAEYTPNKEFQLKEEQFHDAVLTYPYIFHIKPLRINGKSMNEFSKHIADKKLTEDNVKMFLADFYFAVNQLNAKEFKEIVQEEMLAECQGRKDIMENKYSRMLEWIQSWMEKKEGEFIDNKKLEEFFQKINLEIQGSINTVPRNVITNFHKREKEQKNASKVLDLPKTEQLVDILVCGQPGIGKSEFVLKVIEKNKTKFDHIIWINSDSKVELQNAFFELGKRLNVVTNKSVCSNDENLKLTIEKIYKMFSQYKTLFIFDEVRENRYMKEFLPSPCINCDTIYIIATSNYTNIPCNEMIKLECFSIWESMYFMIKELGLSDEMGVGELANLLGNHPMALQLAVSCIKHTKNLPCNEDFSIKDFIKIYDKYLMGNVPENINYEKSLTVMWSISIESVKIQKHGKLAIKILEMMAYMEPEHIPLSIFQNLNESDTEYLYEESLLLLKEYSLINYNNEIGSIHKLLQLVARHNCKIEKEILSDLFKNFEIKIVNSNPEFTCIHVTPHAMKVWSYAKQYEDLIRQFARIPVAIAYTNLSPETSISYIEENISVMERILTTGNENYLHLLSKYIDLLWKCEIYTKVIELCENHCNFIPEPLETYNTELTRIHAISLEKVGKYELSYNLWQKQYWLLMSTLGIDSTATIETFKNMLSTSYKLCKQKNYESWNKFSYLFKQRVSGSSASIEVTIDLLTSISSIVSLESLPDTVKLRLLDTIHMMLAKAISESHVTTLFIMLTKSNQLCAMEREKEAWPLYVRVCQLLYLDAGEQFADFRDFLASLYSLLGSYLDVSQGLLKVIALSLTDSKIDLGYLKLLLRKKLASKAVEIDQEVNSAKIHDEKRVLMRQSAKNSGQSFMRSSSAHGSSGLESISSPSLVKRVNLTKTPDEKKDEAQTLTCQSDQSLMKTSEQAITSSAPGSPGLEFISSPSSSKTGSKYSTSSETEEPWQFFGSFKDQNAQHMKFMEMLVGDDSPCVSQTVKSQIVKIKNLKRNQKYSLVTSECENILAKVPPELMDNSEILSVLQLKAESYHELNELDAAAEIWCDLYDKRCNSIGMDHSDTVNTLLGMLKTALQNEDTKYFNIWFDFILNRIKDTNVSKKKTMNLLKKIVHILNVAEKHEFAITLCKEFNVTLRSTKLEKDPLVLCNMLLKAECMWAIHNEIEAWGLYTYVCNIRNKSIPKVPIKSAIIIFREEIWDTIPTDVN